MLNQLSIATVVIVFSVVLQSSFLGLIHFYFDKLRDDNKTPIGATHAITLLIVSALWLVVGIAVAIWSWAGLFYWLCGLPSVEESIYFATVAFTTLGFGDSVLSPEWRLLSGLAAVHGLILFGLTTAFLADIIFQIRGLQRSNSQ
jgi:hypothetical protein